MSKKGNARIITEVQDLRRSESMLSENGIYFSLKEDNLCKIWALIVGVKGTPYEHGTCQHIACKCANH